MRDIKLFVAIVMIVAVGIFSSGCSEKEVVNQEKEIPVETITIEKSTLAKQVTLAGTVNSSSEILVSTKIPGKIGQIYVQTGALVKKGEILFELENKDLRASVDQAYENLSIAKANLSNIQNGARPQEVEQVNQQVNKAKVQLNLTKANFERMEELYLVEAISKQQFEQASSELELAEASYKSALEQQSLIVEGASKDDIAAAKSRVGLAEANLKMAQAKLNDTIISSPIDGKVGFLKFNVGEFVVQGNPVIQIIDQNNMEVMLGLSESDISFVEEQKQVNVKIPAVPNKEYVGIVSEVSPTVDSQSKVYPVKIKLVSPDNDVKSGMSASILLALEEKSEVLTLAINSVIEEYGNHYVYIVKDGRALKQKVTTGINDGSFIEIKEGLNEGDQVIVKGQNNVTNGDMVISKGGWSY